MVVRSAAHTRKLDRNPCAVASSPSRSSTWDECPLGDRLAGSSGEYQVGAPGAERARFGEDLERTRRQRDAVLAPGLHALARHGPGRRLNVDLAPRREANLAGTGRGQHQEFEREHRRAMRLRLPDLRQRARHVAVGE